MALFRREPQTSVLTAAAKRIDQPSRPENRPKAEDAASLWGLYDELGQVKSALNFKANAASKVDYYPAVKGEPGESPERSEEPAVVEAFERIRGPKGEFADFVGEFCLQLDVAGEGYLVGIGLPDEENPETWDVWSSSEYQRARQNQDTDKDGNLPLTDDDFVLRVWRPHPEWGNKPDSSLRGVVAECEQYILLRAMLSSIATSRLMAGILEIPSGWTFPPKANGDPSPPFFDVLFDAISSAATNSDSGSRLVPTVVMRPDGADAANYLDLARDLPEWVPTLMERVLRQIATGLDLPADILLGLADVNHWNAWLSEDSAKLDYVDPLVLLILDSLTRGYLHPTLREAGVANWQDFLFWRDYSDLISRSVGTEDAVALFDRNIITGEAVRRSVGFTEADAPEESETTGEVVPFPVGPDNVTRGVPGTLTAAGQSFGLGAIDHRLYTQLSEVCQSGLDRALERAGQKIRSHAVGDPRRTPKHPTLAAAIDGVPNKDIGLTLGASVKETLQLTDDELIPETAFDSIEPRVRAILDRGQTETYDTIQAQTETPLERDLAQEDGWLDRAVQFILAGLGVFALKRLFTPQLTEDPAETGEIEPTQIPSPLIFDGMTIAGGGEPGFTPEAPRGLANGQQAQDWLQVAGFQIREREWTIGSPALPFEPHRALRGTRFTEWTDPALTTPLTAGWLGVSFMFPGDHRGCQCVAELVVSDTADLLSPVAV